MSQPDEYARRTCITCKHFYVQVKTGRHSELTPGYEWRPICLRDRFYADNPNTDDLRRVLLTAEACPLFEEELR